MKCPECQSTHVNKNGQKKGKQNVRIQVVGIDKCDTGK